MIRSIASLAIPLLIAAVVLKVVLGVAIGLVFSIAWVGFKLLCIAGIVYCALNLVSPRTAQRLREKLGVDEAPRAS